MVGAGAILVSVLVTGVLAALLWNALARWRRLPPGSMGCPFYGETMEFFSQHPDEFFSEKQRRYGDIIKTRLLGYSAVMLATVEAAKLVLVTEPEIFKPTYPACKEELIGPHAVFFQHGERHKHLRHLLQSFFTPKVIEGSVSKIEERAVDNLSSMDGRNVFAFAEIKRFTFDVGVMLTCGGSGKIDLEDFRQTYHTMEKGYNAYPIKFPGFPFYTSLKARRKLNAIVRKLMAERATSCVPGEDIMGALMEQKLPSDEIADNVIGVIFAAQDTTASVLTWMIKYLATNSEILADVRAEQEAIRSKGSHPEKLEWADTKQMPLTYRVLQETMRLASVLSFTFRSATEDVEYGGYLIPKGWKVMPLFRNIHHNPELYPNPHTFDPSRFEKSLRPNTYLAFGNGIHQCLGSELARVEILTFIHHLVLDYRWKLLEPNAGISYRPFLIPKDGLPIHIARIEG